MHHDAVFTRFFDFGDDDGSFVAVGLVEVGELLERVVADDVGIEDEEGGGILSEGFFGEFERAGGAEGFGFDGEFNVDVVFFFVLDVVTGERLDNLGCEEGAVFTSFRAFSMMSGR